MQKIYVLLRNDQQTGPYSLEEIIQFDLKPYDLVWIEGKSAGWYYPQEIQALYPHLRFLPQKPTSVTRASAAPEKKAFVAVPALPKENEAPAVQSLHEAPPYVPAETHKPSAPAPKNFEEEIYAQFTKRETKSAAVAATPVVAKKKASARSVGVAIATVLVVGGVFAASWVMNRQPVEEEEATATVADAPAQNEIAVANTQSKQTVPATKQKKEKSSVVPKQKATVVKQPPLPKEDPKISTANPVEEKIDNGVAPANEEPAVQKEEAPAPAETTAAPQEKKKKLRDKILDIFRKKPEEPKSEEAKPAETENGERRATRREDGANLAQLVSIRFTVPNDWMMGIKGAKATLVNRGSETVGKAVVEVLYYDDDNNLLQKRPITFSNVDGKESKTISIPDHSTATKVDYNIVSVTGRPGA